MSDHHLLASDLPGVLEGWCGPVLLRDSHGTEEGHIENGRCWTVENGRNACLWYTEHPEVSVRLDLARPEIQHHICLTWGPRVDERWRMELGRFGMVYLSGMCGTCCTTPLDYKSTTMDRDDYMQERIRAHWLSLLGNPAAIAVECRAVVEGVQDEG